MCANRADRDLRWWLLGRDEDPYGLVRRAGRAHERITVQDPRWCVGPGCARPVDYDVVPGHRRVSETMAAIWADEMGIDLERIADPLQPPLDERLPSRVDVVPGSGCALVIAELTAGAGVRFAIHSTAAEQDDTVELAAPQAASLVRTLGGSDATELPALIAWHVDLLFPADLHPTAALEQWRNG